MCLIDPMELGFVLTIMCRELKASLGGRDSDDPNSVNM